MKDIPLKIRLTHPHFWVLLSITVAIFAFVQVSPYWGSIALCFALLIYLMYRRYLDDLKAGKERVDDSDIVSSTDNLNKLDYYISELEKRSAELNESNERLRREAYYDPLTQLPNRKFVLESLGKILEQPESNRFAVLCLNLNRFRILNESLGHGTGDRIIRQVAKRIGETIGDGDVAGHFGGDEFAIVLAEVEDPTRATNIAEEIAKRVSESVRFKNREVYTSASIGIVFVTDEYKRPQDILRDADIAMYNAKDKKRKWMIFDRTMYAKTVERQQVETDLRYAIVCNELESFYQPIVRLRDCELFGFEALVRWNHPRRGLISPSEFIPIAEATGLIVPLTIQMLRDSCLQLAAWQAGHPKYRSMVMSVNFSAANISDPKIVDEIVSVINETGIPPSSLKIEITESAVMVNAEDTIELLRRIKSTGVAISIDDFGTGYSSLSYLHKFPIDYLKIDRSFVGAMENGGENEEIVRTIVALAKALDLTVIAEGIESVEHFRKLCEFGCEYGQGYFFSRPLSVAAVESLLAEGADWAGSLAGRSPLLNSDVDWPIHLESTH